MIQPLPQLKPPCTAPTNGFHVGGGAQESLFAGSFTPQHGVSPSRGSAGRPDAGDAKSKMHIPEAISRRLSCHRSQVLREGKRKEGG